MNNPVLTALLDAFQADLGQRLASGLPLAATLGEKPVLFRYGGPPGPGPRVLYPPLGDLLQRATGWEPVADVYGTFRAILGRVPEAAVLREWGPATAAFDAVAACRLAGPLLRQMGLFDPAALDDRRIPPEFAMHYAAALGGPTETNQHLWRVAARLLEALVRPGLPVGPEARLVRFRIDETRRIQTAWLDENGRPLLERPLDEWLRAVGEPIAADLAEGMRAARRLRRGHWRRGLAILKAVAPGLREALRRARRRRSSAGLRLAMGRDRHGAAIDMWMYIETACPFGPPSACTLAVHRAHREFILESFTGSPYYFPPALLVARMTFAGGTLAVRFPAVRQPAGGHRFTHPYTGTLDQDPFGGAFTLHDESAAMFEPSAEAIGLFPWLVNRTTRPAERGMCLAGQGDVVTQVQARLTQDLAAGREPDVLGCASDLHELLRHGLCQGHQMNGSRPIVPLGDGLPYPVRSPLLAQGALARRVFPYDPCKRV